MDKSVVENEVQKSIRIIIGNPGLKIADSDRLIEDIGFESIDFVDLVFELEKNLKIRFDLDTFSREMMKYNVGRYLEVKVSDMVTYILATTPKA